MSITLEADNRQERNAMIVYWGNQCVGYVRSGEDREQAYSLLISSGRGSLFGRIVDVDRVQRWLWLEVDADFALQEVCEEKSHALSEWSFDDALLPADVSVTRLHVMLCNLETVVAAQEPWDDDVEEWLVCIEDLLWNDISCETSNQVKRILGLLTLGSLSHEEYALAACRLQLAIDLMGSQAARRKQVEQIVARAHSEEMDALLRHYGDGAYDAIRKLPPGLVELFLKDGEAFMGRLWYLHCPEKQLRAVTTLLSMLWRLNEENSKKVAEVIAIPWLIEWAKEQRSLDKALVVQQIVSMHQMEHVSPALNQELQEMMRLCNPQMQAEANSKEIARAVEAQKPPVIGQLNLHDGVQQLGPNPTETMDKLENMAV